MDCAFAFATERITSAAFDFGTGIKACFGRTALDCALALATMLRARAAIFAIATAFDVGGTGPPFVGGEGSGGSGGRNPSRFHNEK